MENKILMSLQYYGPKKKLSLYDSIQSLLTRFVIEWLFSMLPKGRRKTTTVKYLDYTMNLCLDRQKELNILWEYLKH